MNPIKIDNHNEINSQSDNELEDKPDDRPVLSVRLPAKAKQELIMEAGALDITLSERAEIAILTRHDDKIEIDSLKAQVEAAQAKIQSITGGMNELNARYINDTGYYQEEITRLQNQLSELSAFASLARDERLQSLFKPLSGTSVEFTGADGKNYTATFQTPCDLLRVMIYSYNLKKTIQC